MALDTADKKPEANKPKKTPGDGDQTDGKPGVLAALRELATHNPTAATILLSALGIILVVATALSAGVDLESSMSFTPYIVVTGVLLVVISFALNHAIIGQVVLWFAAVLFMGWVTVAVVVRSFMPYSQPVACLTEFWKDCVAIADGLADKEVRELNPAVPEDDLPGPAVPPPADVVPADYNVFVQFGGAIRREDIVAMAAQLAGAGWDMQGADRGGERMSAAVGLSVVRYAAGSDEDRRAAEALAESLYQTGRISERYQVEANPSVRPGNLELWIGRYFGLSTRTAKELLKEVEAYDGPIDDSADGLAEAVRRFQAANDLQVDGKLGPVTTAALLAETGRS